MDLPSGKASRVKCIVYIYRKYQIGKGEVYHEALTLTLTPVLVISRESILAIKL